MSTGVTSNGGTTAGGSLVSRLLPVICVAGALSVQGTVSAGVSDHVTPVFSFSTNSGIKISENQQASTVVMDLRRLSGMTWDQLARLFDVSRRTLHFWASGKAINTVNEERLHRIFSVIRQIDRGSASENRAFLFSAQRDGVTPFDLIRTGRYGDAVSLDAAGFLLQRPKLSPLSAKASASRAPSGPDRFVDALNDRIHSTSGHRRAARARRIKRILPSDETK